MVAPRPLTFEEWQVQQYGNIAPQPTATPPPPQQYVPPPAPPPGSYGPPPEQGYNTQIGMGSQAVTMQPPPPPPPVAYQPGPPTSFGYGPPTQEQRNSAIQATNPPTSFGYGPAPETQPALYPPAFNAAALQGQREALRTADQTGTLLEHATGQVGGSGPAYEAELTRRANEEIARRRNEVPLHERAFNAIGSLPPVAMAGAAKDALAGSGVANATGTLITALSEPQRKVVNTVATRAYDAIEYGDPNRTFSPVDPGALVGSLEGGLDAVLPGYYPFEEWLADPANAPLITQLFEGGYNGEQGGLAVYTFFNEQQGLAGVLYDVATDPFAWGELAMGGAVAGATRLGTAGGRLGTVGRAARTGLEVADAALFDPLKLPGQAVRTMDRIAPGLDLSGRIATGKQAVGNALLTEAGRRGRQLNQAEENAAMLARAAEPTSIPEPWLLERDAAGNVVLVTNPSGWGARPVVRDLDTGVVRVVQPGDVERAMQIAARLPHERAARLAPGQRTTYQQMMDDWMGQVTRNRQPYGLPREIETLYPSRGPLYGRYVQMEAERIKRFGQEAIDANYEAMRTAARTDPVRAALIADRTQAAMEIAGVSDLSAKKRAKEITRIRTAARAVPPTAPGRGKPYTKQATYQARLAANATAPAGGVPMRLMAADVVDVLDDETRQFAEGTLNDGRVIGDVVLEINQDARRLHDLAQQAQTAPLSPWDQSQLDTLLKKYGHEFPDLAADPAKAIQEIASWREFQRQQFVSGNARRQIGMDKGFLDKKGGIVPTGIAASDSLLGKAVRTLDALSAKYKKWQLYNPLNILRYSGLQGLGNAVTIAVADFGALEDYAKAIGHRVKNRGQQTLDSPADKMMQAAGLGRSPFLKQGIKDDLSRADFGRGPFQSLLKAGRTFAGAFDISLREAAYMHRFQPRYRALQMQQAKFAIDRARTMGVPVSATRVEEAIRGLDRAGGAYRAWDAAHLKTALLAAARDTPTAALGAGARDAVENWADRVARDYANGVKTLHKDAIGNVNRLGFTFDETKVDALANRVFMYFYWSSRANLLYTREMLGNPALLNGYVSMWRTLDREAEKQDAPPWLRGFSQFMQSPMGLTVFGNPTALLNTAFIFNPEVLGSEYENNLTDLGKLYERSPFMVSPFVSLPLFVSGALGSSAQTPSIMPVSFGKVYDWLTHWNATTDTPFWTDDEGNPVPPPWPLRQGIIGQEVPKLMAEALSPIIAPALNRLGIPADIMQFGDAAASQSQDIRYLMLDVLAEQNPGMTQEQLNDLLLEEHAGGFDSSDPIYQTALDRYSERAYAGILEGQDVPNVVRGLIDAASPFQRIPQVTTRLENDAILNGYFQANEDVETYNEIAAGILEEPIRLGGFEVMPPSLPVEIPLGGTVITPEALGTMTDRERQEVATAWFTQRNPDYDPTAEIPFPDAAWRSSQIAKAASPEDLALQEAEDRWYNPGTEEQNRAVKIANGIAYNDLPEDVDSIEVSIGGQPHTFDRADLGKMTPEERNDLRWLWLEQPNTGRAEAYEGYYAAREQLVAEEPDLGGFQAMHDLAESYPGGSEQWVRDAIAENPTTYGQYAARLDPARYPEGSPDWVNKMLSLEAYQTLTEEQYQSSAPVIWGDAPGAPVIPGLSGAANLNELYVQQQTEAEGEEFKNRGDYVAEDLNRMGQVLAAADQWDADHGNPVGTSRGLIIDQMANGYQKGVNGIDYDLKELLDAEYPRIGPEGEVWSAIPGPTSNTGEYVIWALNRPSDQRDPQIWARESLLVEEFTTTAERGTTVNELGETVLNPEATPPPAEDILAGYGITRSVDGSGSFLTTQPVATPATPSEWRVGGLGATLYQDASTSSAPLLALRPETPLVTLGESGDWVNLQHPSGLTGWVRKRYLAGGASLPATPPTAAPPPPPPAAREPASLQSAATPTVPPATPPPAPTSSPLGGIGDALGGFVSGVTDALGGLVQGVAGDSVGPVPIPPKAVTPPTPPPLPTATATPSPTVTTTPTAVPTSTPEPITAGGYDPKVIQSIDTQTYVSPNRHDRMGVTPEAIVYHYTVGDLPSFTADFMGQTGRQASSNYVVDRDGTIYQFVDPDDAAWTHGDVSNPRTDLPWLNETLGKMAVAPNAVLANLNTYAIGIEIVNSGNQSGTWEPYTPEQIESLRHLTAYLVERYGIVPGEDTLLGHEEISDHKSDPGPLFPWDEMLVAAGAPPLGR